MPQFVTSALGHGLAGNYQGVSVAEWLSSLTSNHLPLESQLGLLCGEAIQPAYVSDSAHVLVRALKASEVFLYRHMT
jgi:hypothetical protein